MACVPAGATDQPDLAAAQGTHRGERHVRGECRCRRGCEERARRVVSGLDDVDGDAPCRRSRQSIGHERDDRVYSGRVFRTAVVSRPAMASDFATARQILQRAVADRAFPAGTIEVGNSRQPLWREAFGRLTFEPESPQTSGDTVFDLASLTKVLATTSLVMRQVERGVLSLDDPVAQHIVGWRDEGTVVVTISDLLSHCAGLPAHVPFYR